VISPSYLLTASLGACQLQELSARSITELVCWQKSSPKLICSDNAELPVDTSDVRPSSKSSSFEAEGSNAGPEGEGFSRAADSLNAPV
jgi:hypothetical protein